MGITNYDSLTLSNDLVVGGTSTFATTPIITGGDVAATEVVITTNVITASESGKTFFLDLAAGFTSTLPTAALGLNFTFIVKTAPTTSGGYLIVGSPADKIYGTVACSGAENTINGVTANQADNITLVHDVALIGDYLYFIADETNWYVTGNVNTYAAVTANG